MGTLGLASRGGARCLFEDRPGVFCRVSFQVQCPLHPHLLLYWGSLFSCSAFRALKLPCSPPTYNFCVVQARYSVSHFRTRSTALPTESFLRQRAVSSEMREHHSAHLNQYYSHPLFKKTLKLYLHHTFLQGIWTLGSLLVLSLKHKGAEEILYNVFNAEIIPSFWEQMTGHQASVLNTDTRGVARIYLMFAILHFFLSY